MPPEGGAEANAHERYAHSVMQAERPSCNCDPIRSHIVILHHVPAPARTLRRLGHLRWVSSVSSTNLREKFSRSRDPLIYI